MSQQLPDFGEMGAQVAARKERDRIAQEQAKAERAERIERSTQRTFKGIYSRPIRKTLLKVSLQRAERAGALKSTGGESGSGA